MRYPFVKQSGSKNCAAACLLMIVRYYHGNMSLEKMSDLCKTTKSGTSAYHILECAKQLGFEAMGMKCEIQYLYQKDILKPLIAHVTINKKYLHYVVIYEINKKKGYLLVADPQSKISKISFSKFKDIYNGVILVCNPKHTISIENDQFSINRFFKAMILKYKKDIILFAILSLLYTIFTITSTFYLKYLLNGIEYTSYEILYVLCFIFFIVIFLKLTASYFKDLILLYLHQRIHFILSTEIFYRIISLPYHYYQNRTTGEVVSKMNDISEIEQWIEIFVIFFFIEIPICLISGLFLWKIGFLFVPVFCMVLSGLILYIYIKQSNLDIENLIQRNAEVQSLLTESLYAYDTVKGFHLKEVLYRKFQKLKINWIEAVITLKKKMLFFNFLKDFVLEEGFIIMLFLLSLTILNQTIDTKRLITLSFLYPHLVSPIHSFLKSGLQYQQFQVSMNHIADILTYQRQLGIYDGKINGDIVCKHLSYSYDQKLIFQDLNLKIKKGSKAILLGKVGTGKSTFLKLIMKYYPIKRGMLYIDDIDICDYNYHNFANDIIYISQNDTLFTDTLYQNIVLFKNIPKNQFYKVVKACEIGGLVKKHPLGFMQMIEEDGKNFSGGERQKIMLARALLKPFQILLIDEGLGNMDVKLERRLLKNIFTLYPNKTILFVSHRIDNIDLFDDIIRLEDEKTIFHVRKNTNGRYMEI